LRFIVKGTKIVTDLERMGDLAVNICERALELNKEPTLKPYIDLPRMAEKAQFMLKEALDAFVREDTEIALKVCQDDQLIDDLNNQIFRELLTFMLEDPRTISRAIRISFISKYIERIGDHATNIAEDVIYMVKAEDIRHGHTE
jgi:phosphate transport system protein